MIALAKWKLLDLLKACLDGAENSEAAYEELGRLVVPAAANVYPGADEQRQHFARWIPGWLYLRRGNARANGSLNDPIGKTYLQLRDELEAGRIDAGDAAAQGAFVMTRLGGLIRKYGIADYRRDEQGFKRLAEPQTVNHGDSHPFAPPSREDDLKPPVSRSRGESRWREIPIDPLASWNGLDIEGGEGAPVTLPRVAEALDAQAELARVRKWLAQQPVDKRVLLRLRVPELQEYLNEEDFRYLAEVQSRVKSGGILLNGDGGHAGLRTCIMALLNDPGNRDKYGLIRWGIIERILGEKENTLTKRHGRNLQNYFRRHKG